MKNLAFLTFLFATIANADLHQHGKSLGAHEHGSVKLELGVEGQSLEIDLDGPAESFLGFEYAPKSEKEKNKFNEVQRLWEKNLLSLFTFNQTLKCVVSNSSLKQEIELHNSEKGNKHKEEGVHSEIQAAAKITCDKALKDQIIKINLKKYFSNIKKLKLDLVGDEIRTINLTKAIEEIKL